MKVLTGYKVEIKQGFYGHEPGTGYSWREWGSDTRGLVGWSSPVQVGLPDDADVYENTLGDTIVKAASGEAYIDLASAVRAGYAKILKGGQ